MQIIFAGQRPQIPEVIHTEVTSSSVTVRWKLQNYNGGYDMKQLWYYLQYVTEANYVEDSNCCYCHNTTSTQANYIQVVGLPQDTKYNIRVVASNPAGISFCNWIKVATTGIISSIFEITLSYGYFFVEIC